MIRGFLSIACLCVMSSLQLEIKMEFTLSFSTINETLRPLAGQENNAESSDTGKMYVGVKVDLSYKFAQPGAEMAPAITHVFKTSANALSQTLYNLVNDAAWTADDVSADFVKIDVNKKDIFGGGAVPFPKNKTRFGNNAKAISFEVTFNNLFLLQFSIFKISRNASNKLTVSLFPVTVPINASEAGFAWTDHGSGVVDLLFFRVSDNKL